MKIAMMVLGSLLMPGAMWAQNAPAAPSAKSATPAAAERPATPPAQHSYRLRYTLTEFEDSKQTAEQHLMLVITPMQKNYGNVTLRSKVPYATGSYNAGSAGVQTQFNYADVGTTLNAFLDETADGLSLRSTVDQSSISEPATSGGISQPIIRNARMEETALVKTMGETTRLGAFDIPGSKHRVEVSVVVERVN